MFQKQLRFMGVIIFVLGCLSACSILGEPASGGKLSDSAIFTQAAETIVAQLTPLPATQTARATKPIPTNTPYIPPTETPAPVVQPTATAALPTFQPPPLLRANLSTHCRAGPGVAYDIVGLLVPGEDVSLLGKSDPPGWWYIRNPPQRRRQPLSFCWVWSGSTTASGDVDSVPVVSPPA